MILSRQRGAPRHRAPWRSPRHAGLSVRLDLVCDASSPDRLLLTRHGVLRMGSSWHLPRQILCTTRLSRPHAQWFRRECTGVTAPGDPRKSHAAAPGQSAATYSSVYNAPGQTFLPSATSDPSGNCRAFTYDTAGNVANVYDGQTGACSGMTGGAHYSNAYQGDGSTTCGAKPGELCSSTDPKGNVVSYSYDSHGNLTKVTPPAPLGTCLVCSSLHPLKEWSLQLSRRRGDRGRSPKDGAG